VQESFPANVFPITAAGAVVLRTLAETRTSICASAGCRRASTPRAAVVGCVIS